MSDLDDLRAKVRAQYGDGIPARSFRDGSAVPQRDQTTAVTPIYAPRAASSDLPAIDWPVRLTLPWSYLVSDNRKYGVIDGKMLLTSDYRRGKGLVRDKARDVVGRIQPAAVPLRLEARVWVPDDTRAHDVANFAKCVHDALEGVVYTKDRWLYDVHWIRAGVDVDAPRCELTITPLLAAA